MTQLAIYLEESLTLQAQDDVEPLKWKGLCVPYDPIAELSDAIVFYDWILNSSNNVCAIEVHEPDGLNCFSSLTEARPYFRRIIYPQIWWEPQQTGNAMGIEGFGDIAFFRNRSGSDAIVVGLDNWLNETVRSAICRLAKSRPVQN